MPRFDGFIKYDFTTDATQVHEFGAERYGGEGVFVPRSQATVEDDGWLVTYVHDHSTDTSELVIISAQDLTTEPIARIPLPQRVPYGFHGIWVPSI
jgi:carotenoid cleavage dioxygenase